MKNLKETFDKDLAVTKELTQKAVKTAEEMLDTTLDHMADIITGEKMTKETEKAYAENMAEQAAGFGDALYAAASERFGGQLEKAEEYFSADVKAAVEAVRKSKD